MSKRLLEVSGLSVNVEDKEILHGINLEIKKGETHVLMGPNGAGKSTLGYALMGNPRYEVTKGDIWFQGKRINEEPADKRAKAGLFPSRIRWRFRAYRWAHLSAVLWNSAGAPECGCGISARSWRRPWNCCRWTGPMETAI